MNNIKKHQSLKDYRKRNNSLKANRHGNILMEYCPKYKSKDYRKKIIDFKVNTHGDLLIKRYKWDLLISKEQLDSEQDLQITQYEWEVLIPKEQLSNGVWLSDMIEESGIDYGEFVRAYLLACEKAGIKQITIRIYGLSNSYLFEQ